MATISTTVSSAVAAPKRVWVRVVVTELVIIVFGVGAYLAVAAGSADRGDEAAANAQAIQSVEAALHLDVETFWQRAANPFADAYYVGAHFVVPVLVFGLLALRGLDHYRRYRTAFVVTSLIGVLFSWLWPTAPPRLVEGVPGAPVISGAENPYAAFPSMHVGWAVWAALAVGALTANVWFRVLAWSHVVVTSLVVLMTGHHWVLDIVGGVCVAIWIRRQPKPLPHTSVGGEML